MAFFTTQRKETGSYSTKRTKPCRSRDVYKRQTVVYTSGSDSADENEDSDITSTDYYNDSLNYSLKLPQSFVDNGYAKRNPEDDSILFGMKNAMGDASRDPTEDGAIMTLRVDATAVLRSEYGGNWTKMCIRDRLQRDPRTASAAGCRSDQAEGRH